MCRRIVWLALLNLDQADRFAFMLRRPKALLQENKASEAVVDVHITLLKVDAKVLPWVLVN
jgi:hypothetical protein